LFKDLLREVDVDRGSSSGGWVHGLSGDAGRQGCREPSEGQEKYEVAEHFAAQWLFSLCCGVDFE